MHTTFCMDITAARSGLEDFCKVETDILFAVPALKSTEVESYHPNNHRV